MVCLYSRTQDAGAEASARVHIDGAEETRSPLDGLASRVANDVGAVFQEDVLDALAALRTRDRPAFESLLEQLAKANKRLRMGDLRRAIQRRAPRACQTEEGIEHEEADGKPRLLVDMSRRDEVVDAVAELLVSETTLYERGIVVQVIDDRVAGEPIARPVTSDVVSHLVHQRSRPYRIARTPGGELVERDTELPGRIGSTYLDLRGCGKLRPLNGITSAPLLSDDGRIVCRDGYDPATGMLCVGVPEVGDAVPANPSRADAERALLILRRRLSTFPFGDAETVLGEDGVHAVDTGQPPAADESAALAALLTAVVRPSLPRAPGSLFTGAPYSGSGVGKGLLVRVMCRVAYGKEPAAVTAGHDTDEMDKRLVAMLIGGQQVLFLDNVNSSALKSDLLASAITETPARVRVLGSSQLVSLNSASLIMITGNGLSVSEDLARRFLLIELDAHVEDPEARTFKGDIKAEVVRDRLVLLGAVLTIWRWGRQQGEVLDRGQPFGSFEQWACWVRDPLLALGCTDPVERVARMKQNDHRRQQVADTYALWWKRHGSKPVAVADLDVDVRNIIDPQNRGRQYLAAWLGRHVGARVGGFHLVRQRPVGHWGHSTYVLHRLVAGEEEARTNGHAAQHPTSDPFGTQEEVEI
jgi:hypothetical protein